MMKFDVLSVPLSLGKSQTCMLRRCSTSLEILDRAVLLDKFDDLIDMIEAKSRMHNTTLLN